MIKSIIRRLIITFLVGLQILVYSQISGQENKTLNVVVLVDRSPSFVRNGTNPTDSLGELIDYLQKFADQNDVEVNVAGANFGNEIGSIIPFTPIINISRSDFLPDEAIAGTSFIEPLGFASEQFANIPDGEEKIIVLLTDGSPASSNDNVALSDDEKQREYDFVKATQDSNSSKMLVLALSGLNDDSEQWTDFLGQDEYVIDLENEQIVYSRFFLNVIGIDVNQTPRLNNLIITERSSDSYQVTVEIDGWEVIVTEYFPKLSVDGIVKGMNRMGSGKFTSDFQINESVPVTVSLSTTTLTGLSVDDVVASFVASSNAEAVGTNIILTPIATNLPAPIPTKSDPPTTQTNITTDSSKENEIAGNEQAYANQLLLLLERSDLILGILIGVLINFATGFIVDLFKRRGERERDEDFVTLKNQIQQLTVGIPNLDTKVESVKNHVEQLASGVVPTIDSKVEILQPIPKSVDELVQRTRRLPELYDSTNKMMERLNDTPTLNDNFEIIRILERLNPDRMDVLNQQIAELQRFIRQERNDTSTLAENLESSFLTQTANALRQVLDTLPKRENADDWSENVIKSVTDEIQKGLRTQQVEIQEHVDDGLKKVEDSLDAIQGQQETLSSDVTNKLNKQKSMMMQVLLHDYRERYRVHLLKNAEELIELEKSRLRDDSTVSFKAFQAEQEANKIDPVAAVSKMSAEEILERAQLAVNLLPFEDILNTFTNEEYLERNLQAFLNRFVAYATDELTMIQDRLVEEMEWEDEGNE